MFDVQVTDLPKHGERTAQRSGSVIGVRGRHSEARHRPVTEVPIEASAVMDNAACNPAPKFADQLEDMLGRFPGAKLREAIEIDK
jgi:hypothetical protein